MPGSPDIIAMTFYSYHLTSGSGGICQEEVLTSLNHMGVSKNRGTPMGVSKNRGTPKPSILIGFSIINHPFWGPTPIFGSTPISSHHLRINCCVVISVNSPLSERSCLQRTQSVGSNWRQRDVLVTRQPGVIKYHVGWMDFFLNDSKNHADSPGVFNHEID